MGCCEHCSRDYPLDQMILVMKGSAAKRLCSWACARDLAAEHALKEQR